MHTIIYDVETVGGFNQHHPNFKNLFFGWLNSRDGRIVQHLKPPPFNIPISGADPLDTNGWTKYTAVGKNEKYDRKCFRKQFGYELPLQPYDTEVAVHLINETLAEYSLEQLAVYFGYEFPNYKQLVDFKDPSYADDESRGVLELYNRHDLYATKLLKDKTWPILQQQGKDKIFKLMMDFLKVLAEVEWQGVKVDLQELGRQEEQIAEKLAICHVKLGAIAAIEWDSPKQVRELLLSQGYKLPKTLLGNPTVNEAALTKLAPKCEAARILLEFRGLRKQLGTYCTGFRKALIDDMYYPNYRLAGTVSGRLSESFIQVMPRRETSEFKRIIVSKFQGGKLLAVDWAQLELRIIADVVAATTGDTKLADDLKVRDIHAETLARFKTLPDRTRAKNVNFSVFYGGKGYTLTNSYGLTKNEAMAIRQDLLFDRYPAVGKWHLETEKQILLYGKVNAITGRTRHTSDFNEAYNSQIQGPGTDFNKIMMIKCYTRLKKEGYASHPVLDVHDEIVFDCKPEEYKEIQSSLMEEYSKLPGYFYDYFKYELKLDYEGELKVGNNLYDMEKVKNV